MNYKHFYKKNIKKVSKLHLSNKKTKRKKKVCAKKKEFE